MTRLPSPLPAEVLELRRQQTAKMLPRGFLMAVEPLRAGALPLPLQEKGLLIPFYALGGVGADAQKTLSYQRALVPRVS